MSHATPEYETQDKLCVVSNFSEIKTGFYPPISGETAGGFLYFSRNELNDGVRFILDASLYFSKTICKLASNYNRRSSSKTFGNRSLIKLDSTTQTF